MFQNHQPEIYRHHCGTGNVPAARHQASGRPQCNPLRSRCPRSPWPCPWTPGAGLVVPAGWDLGRIQSPKKRVGCRNKNMSQPGAFFCSMCFFLCLSLGTPIWLICFPAALNRNENKNYLALPRKTKGRRGPAVNFGWILYEPRDSEDCIVRRIWHSSEDGVWNVILRTRLSMARIFTQGKPTVIHSV